MKTDRWFAFFCGVLVGMLLSGALSFWGRFL